MDTQGNGCCGPSFSQGATVHQAIQWEDSPPAKKNICTSRSFGKLLTDKSLIAQATANYAAKCAAKLRKQGTCACLLHVFIHTNIHKVDDPQYFRSINIELPVAPTARPRLSAMR
jgi:DNA polymerase V